MNETNELLLRFAIQWGSIFTLLVVHAITLLSGTLGGTEGRRRGLRTAAAYLLALDWALAMGMAAGRSVAVEGTPFWSVDTVKWGGLGVLFIFLPAWFLFRVWLRFSGVFLLPVMPTNRKQRQEAGRALHAYAWGTNFPFYREESGELEKKVGGRITMRGGGPGFVMASSHYAIPLTTGTRDTKVGGNGLVFTGRLEQPRALVDLRLQTYVKIVHTLTRDGIPVKAPMFVIFQIDRRKAKGDGMYPFNSDAVFAALHAQGVGPEQEEEQEELEWGQFVVDRAADLLRDAIARALLDRLLESEEENGPLLCEKLRAGVAQELAQAMEPYGIHALAVGVGNIEVEDEEVLKQRVESWRARWERRRLEKAAQGNAEATRLIQAARADAHRQMIRAITEALQQLADTQTPVPTHAIALRFIDILEDMGTSPGVRELLPESMRGLPTRLRLLME